MVVSQNFSSATSLAMLAPISTLMQIPSFSWITSEMSLSPSGPSSTPWKYKNTHTQTQERYIYIRSHHAGMRVSAQLDCSCLRSNFMYNYNNAARRAKSNLDEGYSQCITLYLALNGVTHFPNKLVRDNKHQDVCILGRLHQVWDGQLRREA